MTVAGARRPATGDPMHDDFPQAPLAGRILQALAQAKSRIEWILHDEDLLDLAAARSFGSGTRQVLEDQAQELGALVEELH